MTAYDGRTALHNAARSILTFNTAREEGCVAVVRALLGAGAGIAKEERDGSTALQLVSKFAAATRRSKEYYYGQSQTR
jgi:hypothetical protein